MHVCVCVCVCVCVFVCVCVCACACMLYIYIYSQYPGIKCLIGDFSCGCDCSFHRHGDLILHSNFCSGQPKFVRTHFDVPVDIFSIVKLTSSGIQGTASNILCPKDKLSS